MMQRSDLVRACTVAGLVLAMAMGAACSGTTSSPEPTAAPDEAATAGPPTKEGAEHGETLVTIGELKGPGGREYLGRTVSVEGIFVRDPVPMLVTDLRLVQMNMPMTDTDYILLAGPEAEGLSGEEHGGAHLLVTGEVGRVNDDAELALSVTVADILDRLEPYNPGPQLIWEDMRKRVTLTPEQIESRRFAILFSGGIRAESNHTRYWNDLKFMYGTLVVTLGFDPAHVVVLYADGTGLDTSMPVDGAGTAAELQAVLSAAAGELDSNDRLLVFTTNHGGGFYPGGDYPPNWYGGRLDAGGDEAADAIAEAAYGVDLNGDGDKSDTVGWDEELCQWGTSHYYDDDLLADLASLNVGRLTVVMEQCFSGGFLPDLSGANRVLISAAGETEPSWSGTSSACATDYDEFSCHFTSALNGSYPDGAAANADDDGDGKVSMVEAFNFAAAHDAWSETPHYDDNGDGVPHTGAMPAGGDGALGATVFLD